MDMALSVILPDNEKPPSFEPALMVGGLIVGGCLYDRNADSRPCF